MTELVDRKCVPCEGGTPALTQAEARKYLAKLDSAWRLSDDARQIRREFRFKDFFRTMSFVNALAHIANVEDHHPDLEVGYNQCNVRLHDARDPGPVRKRLHLRREDRSVSLADVRSGVDVGLTLAGQRRACQCFPGGFASYSATMLRRYGRLIRSAGGTGLVTPMARPRDSLSVFASQQVPVGDERQLAIRQFHARTLPSNNVPQLPWR